MLTELLKNKEFNKIIKSFIGNKEVIDIILYGSAVKGKEIPNDIDMLIIFSDKIEKQTKEVLSYKIKKELEKVNKNFQLISKKYSEIFSAEFIVRESIISEGFSLKNKNFISDSLGYSNLVLFKYSLKNLNNSQRMRFYYSLYGRGKQEGILKKEKAYKFSNEIILSHVSTSEIIKSFLEKWQIKYTSMPIMLPKRILKYKIEKDTI